jgi:glycosyltransferase involved in cell wall biosynthesis
MKILVIHPVMAFLGGGERLCCETIRSLLNGGHEVTILSEAFDAAKVENYFGYNGLFDRVALSFYSATNRVGELGGISHLIHHLRGQDHALKKLEKSYRSSFDLVFSTQEPGYVPDMNKPVIQWGYFPRLFPKLSNSRSVGTAATAIRWLPLRLYYRRKISRIGLVLAISQFSKWYLDREWKRPSTLVYPACNMVTAGAKHNSVVTVARAVPIKRLELFWRTAKLLPKYEFVMLITQDPDFLEYSTALSIASPSNGRVIINPAKDVYHKFLGEAKVYLHLMENEPFGITIVEAMSASCVPVVHDSGGPREIVDEKVGFRWQKIVDVPNMVEKAMKLAPSEAAKRRAQDFNYEGFEKRLSSIFSGFEQLNPRLVP